MRSARTETWRRDWRGSCWEFLRARHESRDVRVTREEVRVMKTRAYLGLLVGGALLQACAAPDLDTERTGRTVSPLKTQAIAVPSYFPEASIWSTMAGQAPPAKVAIINPNS